MNIWVAASDGRLDVVKSFLTDSTGLTANSADPNGYTPIHAAAAYGHIDMLRTLCREYDGDINIRDADGDTPLHHIEDVATATFIIEELNGAYNLTNNEGKTALQVFEENAEDPDLIEYMKLKCGIPLQTDSFGIDKDELAQFKDNIHYTLQNETAFDDLDEESLARRKKLEEIIQGDNAEQELENYIREMIRSSQILDGSTESHDEEPDTKRRR
ncbi:uncharacterized protein KNAG_0I02590 [Huiozyma naganishii CBS 8797]|uniref:Uncharacterized protein n=1 Tax=Huiozyma naganishii (strain ATCC MYA-139 / BCRC 22969 / CBS 8797 / KCTC 17520 / NBRC 10181 / NCYC 3082 / Yp74L-3) TaxID=1071383 RepID=J7S9E1_HUIN7|nr:hypothetical protein KNAG_0I02590 [Kazachstania naganishii CBS 8797]CCK72044.1 hypothetical protein KNAG_0I02590 [Kazachstania naganishii CBS 8797]